MSDKNGWPGEPGVPLNPEKRAKHWLSVGVRDEPTLFCWVPTTQMWRPAEAGWEDEIYPPAVMARSKYEGPCHTPAEVAAREAAAAEAMREACAAIVAAHAAAAKRCSEEGDVIYRIRAEFLANSYALTQAANDVRALPLAPDAAAVLARVRAEERAKVQAEEQVLARIIVAADLMQQATDISPDWVAMMQSAINRFGLSDALARRIAEAEARGMERAAGIAQKHFDLRHNDRARFVAGSIAAAIRAAAKERTA
jgi:hypothetical protein